MSGTCSKTMPAAAAGIAAALRRARRGLHSSAIDAEKLTAVIAALDGGATKAGLPQLHTRRLAGATPRLTARLPIARARPFRLHA
jgi:hypothetical protein